MVIIIIVSSTQSTVRCRSTFPSNIRDSYFSLIRRRTPVSSMYWSAALCSCKMELLLALLLLQIWALKANLSISITATLEMECINYSSPKTLVWNIYWVHVVATFRDTWSVIAFCFILCLIKTSWSLVSLFSNDGFPARIQEGPNQVL